MFRFDLKNIFLLVILLNNCYNYDQLFYIAKGQCNAYFNYREGEFVFPKQNNLLKISKYDYVKISFFGIKDYVQI